MIFVPSWTSVARRLAIFAVLLLPATALAQDSGTPPPGATPHVDSLGDSSTVLLRGLVDALPSPPVIASLSRWTYQSGAMNELSAPGPELYAVESGVLSLRVDGPGMLIRGGVEDPTAAAEELMTPGVDYTLRAGDQVIIRAETAHVLRNDGDEPVVLLNVVVFPSSTAIPSWLSEAGAPPGVILQPLASDLAASAAEWPAGPAEILVVRMTLAAAETRALPPLPPEGGFGLIVVEEGTLTLLSDAGTADRARTHGAGAVVRRDPATESAARNGGESTLVLLVLMVRPTATGDGTTD